MSFILSHYKGESTEKIEKILKSVNEYINVITGVKEYRDSEAGSAIKKMDASFETVCAVMEKNGFTNPEKMTTFKFLHRIQVLEKQKEMK